MAQNPILSFQDLKTHFFTGHGVAKAVDGVSMDLGEGETLGIVGESGSGKTVTCLSVLRLVPSPGRIVGGRILFEGRDLAGLAERELQQVRGKQIGMVFQDPMTSLNPFLTIGDQVAEPLLVHDRLSRREARRRAAELLGKVGIPEPASRLSDYPHRFSGGMRQRVMIAMALIGNPKVLIADEPTTALDVTIQAQVLELFRKLKEEFGTAILLITHNLGVVAGMADRVAVMYAGRVVEMAETEELFTNPRHPYTIALLRAVPRLEYGSRQWLEPIAGTPPDLTRLPAGCSFYDRCPFRQERCQEEAPSLAAVGEGHQASCWVDVTQKK
ncbi:MAG: ABC transporter ATP-binding protein [Acidobacteria bacterium]|nr:ABC transporter ATP-binding protein [Acidobacteriota bacterium]